MLVSGTAGHFAVLSHQPTLNVIFFRCLFGCVALLIWIWYRGGLGDFRHLSRALLIMTSGVFLIANWVALFEAFRHVSIGFVSIIYHLQPFWIVLAGGLFLGEKLTRAKLAWVLVGFMGLVFTVLPKVGDFGSDPNWLVGAILALVASLLYAGATLTTRALKGIKPDVLSAVHCALGMVFFALFLDAGALGAANAQSWSLLAGLGIVHTGIVYVLLYSAYPKLPTTIIATSAFLNPAAALIADYLVFGRTISPMQAVGLALILAAGLAANLGWSFAAKKVAAVSGD